MKSLVFRPLRIHKKSGKIIVASYMQWRKVKTADYSAFNLVVKKEYANMDQQAFVYNHKCEHLFWKDFDPDQIPYLPPYEIRGEDYEYPKQWRTNYGNYILIQPKN